MSQHSILIERTQIGATRNAPLGADALDAVRSIPGVLSVDLIVDGMDCVEVAYEWDGDTKIWEVYAYLGKFGCQMTEKEKPA